jgi:hypothetical protein
VGGAEVEAVAAEISVLGGSWKPAQTCHPPSVLSLSFPILEPPTLSSPFSVQAESQICWGQKRRS